MKRSFSLVIVLFCSFVLVGCGNKENEEKITQQSKTIESQSKTIESLSKENETLNSDINKKEDIKLTKGESVNLSGKATVGEEIPSGIYDIKADSNSVGIAIDSPNKDWNDYLVMSSNDNENYEKERKSYNLKDGYSLEITGNATFTKVK